MTGQIITVSVADIVRINWVKGRKNGRIGVGLGYTKDDDHSRLSTSKPSLSLHYLTTRASIL